MHRAYDLMALLGCGSFEELYERVRSSRQMAGWFAYLDCRDEEEAARLQAMFGTENKKA